MFLAAVIKLGVCADDVMVLGSTIFGPKVGVEVYERSMCTW